LWYPTLSAEKSGKDGASGMQDIKRKSQLSAKEECWLYGFGAISRFKGKPHAFEIRHDDKFPFFGSL
jgi:hypothetical protein